MNRISIFFFLFTIIFFGCRDKAASDAPAIAGDTAQKPATAAVLLQIDSNMLFTVDDYPVSDDMFENKNPDNSARRIKSGDVYALDQLWFGNNKIRQVLVVELATDYWRNIFYHFYKDDIPTPLIEQMGLNLESGDTATTQQKINAFDGLVKQSQEVGEKFFTTKKGFKLGDDKQKAISVYGDPHQVTRAGNIEILDWRFFGDQQEISKEEYNGKRIAKGSYGHEVRMFFKGDKLIAMIIHNDIP